MELEFKDRLAKLMREHNINKSQLSKKIDIEQAEINEWLKGSFLPNIYSILKLAKVFNTNTDYLLNIKENIILTLLTEGLASLKDE